MRIAIIFLLFSVGIEVQAQPAIDDLFSDYNHPDVPGAAVTIIQNGQVVLAKGYGLADVENRVPVTPVTNFRLASLSKQFTAMAVMILVERGALRLDSTLIELFPGFPQYGAKITVRYLLNHLSGLIDYEDLIPSDQTAQVSDDDVLALLEKQDHTYFAPGSRYRYCNGGYVLLGLIIERVSGMPLPDFMTLNIFQPLGMIDTVMFQKGITQVVNRAYGYTKSSGGFEKTDQSVTSATRGDGGVYTSVIDLFKWDQALYGESLVSSSMLQLAFTSAITTGGERTGYGFGWEVGTYRGLDRLSHTGSTIGFRTAIARFPGQRFCVSVLVNRADVSPWDTAEKITDRFLFP